MLNRLTLAGQYALASLAILAMSAALIGSWVGGQIEHGVLIRAASITSLYVESVVEPFLQPLAQQLRLPDSDVAALDRVLVETALGEQVVAFKIWSPDGQVVYSPNRELIGQRFSIQGGLARAVDGEVTAHVSDLASPENAFERQRWSRLVEVYVPVRERGGSRIVAVVEFYQLMDELDGAIAEARLQSWGVVAATTLVAYLLLAVIVKRGSDTISTQQRALGDKVTELSNLLEQNARLHERVRRAAERATALDEEALRRVSADLHDGPGQALALALLRLDDLQERGTAAGLAEGDFAVVHQATQDALGEIRAISAGLRLPELDPLSVTEVVQRAVAHHERRGGAAVALEMEGLPRQAPLAVKIAVFRSLQEALSNATRHGRGAAITVRVWTEPGFLCLKVADRGPGFTPADDTAGAEPAQNGHLGLASLRERAELLGGSFQIESAAGQGTVVLARWPVLAEVRA